VTLLRGGPVLAVEFKDERFLKHFPDSRLLCD
jgi:hypothetical protein